MSDDVESYAPQSGRQMPSERMSSGSRGENRGASVDGLMKAFDYEDQMAALGKLPVIVRKMALKAIHARRFASWLKDFNANPEPFIRMAEEERDKKLKPKKRNLRGKGKHEKEH